MTQLMPVFLLNWKTKMFDSDCNHQKIEGQQQLEMQHALCFPCLLNKLCRWWVQKFEVQPHTTQNGACIQDAKSRCPMWNDISRLSFWNGSTINVQTVIWSDQRRDVGSLVLSQREGTWKTGLRNWPDRTCSGTSKANCTLESITILMSNSCRASGNLSVECNSSSLEAFGWGWEAFSGEDDDDDCCSWGSSVLVLKTSSACWDGRALLRTILCTCRECNTQVVYQ